VDKYLETNVKGIFALGDAVGHFQYVYHDILNSDKKISVDYAAMPHAIFSSPQVAGVGLTEIKMTM
jgi:mycothione reductase